MTTTRAVSAAVTFGELKVGDWVLADPVHGAEEVVRADRMRLMDGSSDQWPSQVAHLGLRGDASSDVRFIARFLGEPCIRLRYVGLRRSGPVPVIETYARP